MKHKLKYLSDSHLKIKRKTYEKLSFYTESFSKDLVNIPEAFNAIDKLDDKGANDIFAKVSVIIEKATGKTYQRSEFDKLLMTIKSRNKALERCIINLLSKFK